MSRKPTIFLDRDGVLTVEKSYVYSMDQLEIFPYAAECVTRIHQLGYYAIVITNQSGIARGLFSEEELQKMNQALIEKTGVDAVYYCPHFPQGIIKKYARICNCRKPQTGLIDKACADFKTDLIKSYMVGDRASDIATGQKMGLRTVLLESGYGTARLEKDIKPDYILHDLRDVISIL